MARITGVFIYIIKMKPLYWGFILTLLLSFCNSSKKQTEKIEAVKYIVNYPVINKEIDFYYNIDTINVYTYKNYIFYELPYQEISIINSKTTQTKSTYFFVRRDTAFYGYCYNHFRDNSVSVKYAADSFLQQRAYKNDFSTLPEVMVLNSARSNNGKRIEKYNLSSIEPAEMFDTVFVHYDKRFKNIQFSFAPKLDSINDSKINKVELLFNDKYSKEAKKVFPKRIFSYEMQVIQTKLPIEIETFIKKHVQSFDK